MAGEQLGNEGSITLSELLAQVYDHAATQYAATRGYDVEAGAQRLLAYIAQHREELRMGLLATENARMDAYAAGDEAGVEYAEQIMGAIATEYGSHMPDDPYQQNGLY